MLSVIPSCCCRLMPFDRFGDGGHFYPRRSQPCLSKCSQPHCAVSIHLVCSFCLLALCSLSQRGKASFNTASFYSWRRYPWSLDYRVKSFLMTFDVVQPRMWLIFPVMYSKLHMGTAKGLGHSSKVRGSEFTERYIGRITEALNVRKESHPFTRRFQLELSENSCPDPKRRSDSATVTINRIGLGE